MTPYEQFDAALAILDNPETPHDTRMETVDVVMRSIILEADVSTCLILKGRLITRFKDPWNAGVLWELGSVATFYSLTIRDIPKEIRNVQVNLEDVAFFRTLPNDWTKLYMINAFSVNRNGYIREAAVDAMLEIDHIEAYTFLLPRLADNVANIREKAAAGLRRIFKYEHREFFIFLIDRIDHLALKKRVDPVFCQDLLKFIFNTNPRYAPRIFATPFLYPDTRSRALKNHLSFYPYDVALMDKFKLRKKSSEWAILLPFIDILTDEYRTHLLQCSIRSVRLKALLHLRTHKDFSTMATNALTDSWYKIRRLAQAHAKLSHEEIAKLYLANIRQRTKLAASLAGLGELGFTEYAGVASTFLEDPATLGLPANVVSHKVRAAAFRAYTMMAPEQAYTWALKNLSTSSAELRQAIVSYLKSELNKVEILTAARQHLATTTDNAIRTSLQVLIAWHEKH